MKALVYRGPGDKAVEDRPRPELQAASDAIVNISRTTICGTDLHILKGDVPTCTPGRILGHEGVGVVEEAGAGVSAFLPGSRVLISCVSSCGKCEYCRRGMYSHCTTGGWILGNTIDGTQAEYVRIPHADTSLYPIPEEADEEALVMLSDILPTGFECGVLNGKVAPGSTVAIVGAGPIGLAALLTAQFYAPAEIIMIDLDDNRLDVARRFGATQTINSGDGKAADTAKTLTGGRGVDTAIEAVGVPATFLLCQELVAPGGIIANVGVHGSKVDLHLERLWSHNIAITTRLVDTVTTPMLLKTVQAKKVWTETPDHTPVQARPDPRCLCDVRQCRSNAGPQSDHRGVNCAGHGSRVVRGRLQTGSIENSKWQAAPACSTDTRPISTNAFQSAQRCGAPMTAWRLAAGGKRCEFYRFMCRCPVDPGASQGGLRAAGTGASQSSRRARSRSCRPMERARRRRRAMPTPPPPPEKARNPVLPHMWTGPVGKVSFAQIAVGRCSHMSGLLARHFQRPRAGMVIC